MFPTSKCNYFTKRWVFREPTTYIYTYIHIHRSLIKFPRGGPISTGSRVKKTPKHANHNGDPDQSSARVQTTLIPHLSTPSSLFSKNNFVRGCYMAFRLSQWDQTMIPRKLPAPCREERALSAFAVVPKPPENCREIRLIFLDRPNRRLWRMYGGRYWKVKSSFSATCRVTFLGKCVWAYSDFSVLYSLIYELT